MLRSFTSRQVLYRQVLALAAVALALVALPQAASAQKYPERPVRLVLPLGAAGVGRQAGGRREEPDAGLARFPGDATVMAYIGRSGWNDLSFSGTIPDDDQEEAVDESYRLVVSKLPKRDRPPGWDASA